jgi:hypothetical protein
MERSRGVKSGAAAAVRAMFLAAALVSAGCGENALMNPTATDMTQGQQMVQNQAGQDLRPAGQNYRP